MFFALLIAFCAPLFHAGSNVLDSYVSGSIFKRTSTVVFYLGLTNIIVVPFLFLFGQPDMPNNITIWYFIVLGVIATFYQIPYFMALKRMDTSIVAAMFSLGTIILPFLAYFMVGEELLPVQYVGFFIVISANLALNLKKSAHFKVDLSFWLMLMVSLLLSFDAVLIKQALIHTDWITLIFWEIIFSDIFILCFLIPHRIRESIVKDFPIFRQKIKMLMGMEILDRAAGLCYIFALSMLPVVVDTAIENTQPIFVLIYGVLLYKIFKKTSLEKLNRADITKKMICFAFIIVGVILTIRG